MSGEKKAKQIFYTIGQLLCFGYSVAGSIYLSGLLSRHGILSTIVCYALLIPCFVVLGKIPSVKSEEETKELRRTFLFQQSLNVGDLAEVSTWKRKACTYDKLDQMLKSGATSLPFKSRQPRNVSELIDGIQEQETKID